MSEYQYYEFQAIDRTLTTQEQGEIRGLSRRVQLSSTQAIFTYSYGDYRGGPLELLETHFDALLYVANWGSKQLAFRFPRSAVEYDRLMPYYFGVNEISLKTTQQHVVLDISFQEEEGHGWIEGEGVLDGLVPLREDIVRGDFHALYLAWLKSALYLDADYDDAADVGASGDDELFEPPVPPGLLQLSEPLQAFIDFFDIDADLIAAAAQASPPLSASEDRIEQWVRLLPEVERNDYLIRLAQGEPRVDRQLLRRLREVGRRSESEAVQSAPMPRRSLASILATAEELRQRKESHEREAAERSRLQRLAELAELEPSIWVQVNTLIDRKQGSAYDEAVAMLVELRGLAVHQGELSRFNEQVSAVRSKFSKRPALIERLRTAGLLGNE